MKHAHILVACAIRGGPERSMRADTIITVRGQNFNEVSVGCTCAFSFIGMCGKMSGADASDDADN
jgi:hypothetical protein